MVQDIGNISPTLVLTYMISSSICTCTSILVGSYIVIKNLPPINLSIASNDDTSFKSWSFVHKQTVCILKLLMLFPWTPKLFFFLFLCSLNRLGAMVVQTFVYLMLILDVFSFKPWTWGNEFMLFRFAFSIAFR